MKTKPQQTDYGHGALEIFTKLSAHPAVRSIQGSGWTFVDGKASPREFSPGGFEKLIRQLNQRGEPYWGDAIVSVDEEVAAIAEDVIAALGSRGWRWLHTAVSGRTITLWVAQTTDTRSFYQITGTLALGWARLLKDLTKRDRMAAPTNSPDQGSFITWRKSPSYAAMTPDGIETTATDLWMPNGEILKVLSVPEEYAANDGDALLNKRATLEIGAACEMILKTDDLDSLQVLISAEENGLKAMGQTEFRVAWPEGWEEWDILIGSEGVLPNTRRALTMGKATARYPSTHSHGLVFADGMETVPNVYSRYFSAATMVSFGRAAAKAKLLEQQVEALKLHESRDADWHAEDVVQTVSYSDEPDPWAEENEKEKEFAANVREAYGSVFAHPRALGHEARGIANRIRGMANKNTTSRDGRAGMPGAILPGAKLKLAHWFFGGTREPDWGELAVGWRPDGSPYLFTLNPKQWAGAEHAFASDGDDCDDMENIVAGAEKESDKLQAIMGRTPSSPGGGEHFDMTPEGDQWRRYSVVLPLKENWGHNPENLHEQDAAFSMGPEVETQQATHDLMAILQACRFSAGQSKYIGQFADALQTLFLSGVPADELAYRGSDLLDNIWNQKFDGAHIVREIHRYCVERVRRNEPWFEPIYGRIRRAVNEMHEEMYGTPANPRFGKYPEWEETFTGLIGTNDLTDMIDLTLAYRCNGPVELLTNPVDQRVAIIGAALVIEVEKEWTRWRKNNTAISRAKGMRRKKREEQRRALTKATLDQIRALTEKAYEKACEGEYIPGDLTTAIRQASIALGMRWDPPKSGSYRVLPSRKALPKTERKLLHNLPASETAAHYRQGNNSDPSWLTRLSPAPEEPDLLPGDHVYVEQGATGRYEVRREGSGELIATLRREGFGMVGLSAQFIGWVHKYDAIGKAQEGFYRRDPIAIFRNRHREVLGSLQAKAANAAEEFVAMSM